MSTHNHISAKAPCATAQCTVCHKHLARPIYSKFSQWMYQCRSCQVVFTYPMISQAWALERYSLVWFEQAYLPSYGVDPHQPTLANLAPRHHAELAPAY